MIAKKLVSGVLVGLIVVGTVGPALAETVDVPRVEEQAIAVNSEGQRVVAQAFLQSAPKVTIEQNEIEKAFGATRNEQTGDAGLILVVLVGAGLWQVACNTSYNWCIFR